MGSTQEMNSREDETKLLSHNIHTEQRERGGGLNMEPHRWWGNLLSNEGMRV